MTIIGLKESARELAQSVEAIRQQTLSLSNGRIEVLERKARELARFVETTRLETQVQTDLKTEALEQKARDLADSVEGLRNRTRVEAETEIEALGQKARDLADSVEHVRNETREKFDKEVATLGQRALDLAASVKAVHEETLLQSDAEIAALGVRAESLAASVESIREVTQQESDAEIAALGKKAIDLAAAVERSRLAAFIESDRVIRKLNEELEQRVRDRTMELEAANKELESFSYSVSHDLRAPLRAIDGFSRIVLDEHADSLPEQAKKYLNLVRTNTLQMGQLVDDLLAFSRLGRLGLTKHVVNQCRMARLCLDELLKGEGDRRVDVTIGEMPPCQGDPNLLKQVWMNLLSNGLKYTHKRDDARIEIGSRTGPRPSGIGTEVIYFIADNGAGFNMKYAHKLFGVFQRLHRAADYEGTGVGLAIVQRIVHRHGGRVWAEAVVNGGATFFFTLD